MTRSGDLPRQRPAGRHLQAPRRPMSIPDVTAWPTRMGCERLAPRLAPLLLTRICRAPSSDRPVLGRNQRHEQGTRTAAAASPARHLHPHRRSLDLFAAYDLREASSTGTSRRAQHW